MKVQTDILKIIIISFLLLFNTEFHAQGVSINADNAPPDASAILDVSSNTKGVLLPRLTKIQREAIQTPAAGLMLYQTDNGPGLYMFDGNTWQLLTTNANVWSTGGNEDTDPANQFLGTTDSVALRLRVNNKWIGAFDVESGNIFLGDSAGINNVIGFDNIAIGRKAFLNSNYSYWNIGIGGSTLQDVASIDNIAIGYYAMHRSNSGYSNCALGNYALQANTAGSKNVALGSETLYNNTVGEKNVAVGALALFENSIGNNNVAVGYQTLYRTDIGYDNTAIGTAAMYYNEEGIGNTAIGRAALQYSLADYNTGVGFKSLFGNTSGTDNTAIGSQSLEANTTGYSNVAIGTRALLNSNGSYNIAVGRSASYSNTSGYANIAVGFQALYDNLNGDNNVAVGDVALSYNTTGNRNTSVGSNSLYQNTSGTYNVALGSNALTYNKTGSYNIAIGADSGTNLAYTNLYNTIGISNTNILHTVSNQVVIGNTSTTHIGGVVPWEVYSDARIKKEVREDVVGLDFITRLRPVTYHRDIDVQVALTGNTPMDDFPHKYDGESIRYTGFIAQEVETAAIVSGYNFSGINKPANEHSLYSLSYESFVVPLVKAVQEQQTIIEYQEQQLSTQSAMIEQQQLAIEKLMQSVSEIQNQLDILRK